MRKYSLKYSVREIEGKRQEICVNVTDTRYTPVLITVRKIPC